MSVFSPRALLVLLPVLLVNVSGAVRADADAGVDAATPTPSAAACGPVTLKGCCAGAVLRYCAAGALFQVDCTSDPSCGWNTALNYYSCGTEGWSDPSGSYPKECPEVALDGGVVPADAGPADLPGGDLGQVHDLGGPAAADSVLILPGDRMVLAADTTSEPPVGETGGGCAFTGPPPPPGSRGDAGLWLLPIWLLLSPAFRRSPGRLP